MPNVQISPSPAGHIGPFVKALVAGGWTPLEGPERGRLRRNGQLLQLRTPHRSVALRVLIWKIGESSRGRQHERRVELTMTYGHGLEPVPGYNDVVLGFDPRTQIFVGLDPLRLEHGGETSNASSFIETVGLSRTPAAPFVILTRRTKIFPQGEHQAFFSPERLPEYLFNFASIHSGTYQTIGNVGPAPFAPGWIDREIGEVSRQKARGNALVLQQDAEPQFRAARLTDKAVRFTRTSGRAPKQMTPEELRAIQLRQEENGLLGEEFVLRSEKQRLVDAERQDLADRVQWISRTSIGEGYDIHSFEEDGTPRYIEVKSTEGYARTFEASTNEWTIAQKLGHRYCIYRVTNVRGAATISAVLRDPVRLAAKGVLTLSTSSWRITIARNP